MRLLAAAFALLLFGTAHADPWPYGATPAGFGSFSIYNWGPYRADQGQVLAGMSSPTGRLHFHTTINPFDNYYVTCHGAGASDTPFMLAHYVAFTWWRSDMPWAALPAGSPYPGPNNLPRPQGMGGTPVSNGTGGTTTLNQGVDARTNYRLLPWATLIADGLIMGNGNHSANGNPVDNAVEPNTNYVVDLVVQSVDGGLAPDAQAYGLGTTCTIMPAPYIGP